jgi:hypothetical protein
VSNTVPYRRLVSSACCICCSAASGRALGLARPGRVVFRCVEGYGSWMYPSIDRTLSPRVYGYVSYHTEGEGSTPKVQNQTSGCYVHGYYYRARWRRQARSGGRMDRYIVWVARAAARRVVGSIGVGAGEPRTIGASYLS